MTDVPRPRGRGALLQSLAAAAAVSPGTPQQPPEEAPRPSGRGKLLAKLKQLQEGQDTQPGTSVEPQERPKGRGRAALIQKLQELQLGAKEQPEVDIKGHKEEPSERPPSPEEEVEEPACKFAGTAGTRVPITANYIRLEVEKDKGVFEYEVIFSEQLDSKHMRIKALNSQLEKLGGIKTFDGGHCLYLPIKLPEKDTVLPILHPGEGTPMTMTIRFKKQKRLGDCLHLFNTLFKRIMRALLMVQFNRSYFDMKSMYRIPQYRLEIIPGIAVACDEYEGGLMLCMDTEHRVLRSQTVYELLYDLKRIAGPRFKDEAVKMLLGATVLTKYNNKNYIIDEILWEGTPCDTFETSTGEKISYIQYYKMQYDLKISDHSQPLLLNKRSLKQSGTAEKVDRIVCLVPELCNLTGITDEMRNDYKVMKEVAQYTRLLPAQRMQSLKKFMERMRNSPESRKILSDWGLKLADATIDLQARVLSNEIIYFGRGASFQTDHKADWTGSMSKNAVTGPVNLYKWVVLYSERDNRCAKEFSEAMVRLGGTLGCQISPPQLFRLTDDRTANVVRDLMKLITPDLQCVVLISHSLRTDLYTAMKKVCCVQQPVASQMILSKTLTNQKRFRACVQKIALQINCKLGGTLWELKLPVRTWMVIGIDVYHSAGKGYSWCGFVASLNEVFTRYISQAVKQTKEVSDFLKLCLREALTKYHEIRGEYPTQIVVFRDGVGNGQLDYCRNYEIRQIEECIRDMELNIEICFIVVQKRINTRLMMIRGEGHDNPQAGLIVDHTICRKYLFDFFLTPQHVNQGTATPTHYIVLKNTSNLKPDIVQKLTFKMCHLYYNWTGTVRVPAPCQYAHKLAYLIGQYVQLTPSEQLNTRLYFL